MRRLPVLLFLLPALARGLLLPFLPPVFVLPPGDATPVAQAAVEYSRDHNGARVSIVPDAGVKYPQFKEPLLIVPAKGETQVTVNLDFDLPWWGVSGAMPDGQAMVQTRGMKGGSIRGLNLSLLNDHTAGFWIGGDDATPSSGGTVIENVLVSMTDRKGCVGFLIGGDPSEHRGDDYSGYILRNVGIKANTTRPFPDFESKLRDVVARNNVGILWQGQNDQASSVYDLNGSSLAAGCDHLGGNPDWPGLPGGKGVVYHGGNSSGLGQLLRVDGGFSVTWVGGRLEDSIGVALHGNPYGQGVGTGSLTIVGLTAGGLMPSLGPVLGLQGTSAAVLCSDNGHSSWIGSPPYGYRGTPPLAAFVQTRPASSTVK